MKTYVVARSGNAKTGPMAATYRQQASCPTTCAFLNNGCYAGGRIFSISDRFGDEGLESLLALKDQPMPNGIRFNVSGDFLGDDSEPDLAYIAACNAVADAHPDVVKIAYTHAWRVLDPAMFTFTVNASCETTEEAVEAVAAGWQVVMVNPDFHAVAHAFADHKPVLLCLAQSRGLSCAECRVCGNDVRTRPIIAFQPHGAGKISAEVATRQPTLF